MKYFVSTLAIICLFTACWMSNGNSKLDIPNEICSDYTANAAAIEEKKQEMLSIADSVGHFWFSDDTEFQSQDPHAYWLMNRMRSYTVIPCSRAVVKGL